MLDSFRRRVRRPLGGLVAATLLATSAPALAAVAVPGLLPAATAVAQDPAVTYKPTVVPDRITLTPTSDPKTSQNVVWRTSEGVREPKAELRVASSLTYQNDQSVFVADRNTKLTTDLGYVEEFHSAKMTGLQPGTTYQYRVGDGTNWSEWQHFTTEAASPEPFSFIYFGDIQNGIKSQASRVVRNAFRDAPKARMVLQAGDLVDDAESDEQWAEVYEATSYGLGTKQFMMAPGNHEYNGTELSRQFSAQFTYPANGPTGTGPAYDVLKGTVYSTDYQGVRFIALNSNASSAEPLAIQTAWLKEQLTNNPNKWTVVYFHHPVFSLDEGRNNRAIREAWLPVFEQYGVDLVLQGHDHGYGRGNTDAAEKDLPKSWNTDLSYDGPVYVVSNVGEKQYKPGSRVWDTNDAHLRRMGGGLQLYQVVNVENGKLRYESRTADGKYYDGLTIVKNQHGKAVTDDRKPDVIDPTDPGTCLGCENPENPENPGNPGNPDATYEYRHDKELRSVDPAAARLPAGVAFSQERDTLFLGDQNSRTIWEIDPDTDKVLHTMTLPENIRDLGIDDTKKLLYVGQQNKNWVVVSLAEANYGQVVRGPYPISESNRSLDIDPARNYVYAAIPARGVEVFDATTGASIGTINNTVGAYYVAADPTKGNVAVAYFEDTDTVKNVEVFNATNNFAKVWAKPTRPDARQVDIDSTNGLVYVGFTGIDDNTGGFAVYDLANGKLLTDKSGKQYGKDGYGITVDEERQRVFVSNRDHRLNPPGQETNPASVTVSRRVVPETPDYGVLGDLKSVDDVTAQLPAGVAFSQERDTLFLGDQNSRTIWEIDPDTDKVLHTMTLPENIRDLGIDDDKKLLYVGQQNKNWVVVSLAEANYGQVVRGPYPISESNRSLDIDPARNYVYAAIPARGVEVFDATTGASIGTINNTVGAYYVAADPTKGNVAVAYFEDTDTVKNVEVFNATNNFAKVWAKPTRPDARQVDIDSTNGLVYVGFTGIDDNTGGFAVYDLANGKLLTDKSGKQYGKDGYGITVDEERQRVFVSNRDHRLNPPGQETTPVAVTVSQRYVDGKLPGPVPGSGTGEPGGPDPGTGPAGDKYKATALTVLPDGNNTDVDDKPVGSAVDPQSGLLYVGNEQRPARVRVVDPAADKTERVLTLSIPTDVGGVPGDLATDNGVRDVALDPTKGELYVGLGNQWVVVDSTTGALERGPFAFDANVRGLDVDLGRGRVIGATRGAGFVVMDAQTGAMVQQVAIGDATWRSHGVAYDAQHDLVYVSNSDSPTATVGLRVFKGADYSQVAELARTAPQWRSVAVDPGHGRIYLGEQNETFDNSGVTVLKAEDLTQVARLSPHQYGNKVYGIAVDPTRHRIYVSARDRYPAGLIRLELE